MTTAKILVFNFVLLAGSLGAQNQQAEPPAGNGFAAVQAKYAQKLEAATKALATLQGQIRAEKVPLVEELGKLEKELLEVRSLHDEKVNSVDQGNLDVSTLTHEKQKLAEQAGYLSNNLGQYIREFDARLLGAERARYSSAIKQAELAVDNKQLSAAEVYDVQVGVVRVSLDRLAEALGGTRFAGRAVDPDGVIHAGRFALLGPAALFRSQEGRVVGMVEQRLNTDIPGVVPFQEKTQRDAAAALIEEGKGAFPFDSTLGNAHKLEGAEETFLEHVKKGGAVMVPIFAMAALALLIALTRWFSLMAIPKPSKKRLDQLMDAVEQCDTDLAESRSRAIRGPAGKMLTKGVKHIDEPKELIEEVMYEEILGTRLKVQRMLPFIAICAASAPLLGLLGTVTGIIDTFKQITLFGSGDVKMLSGGISKALITTKFGLIVAIPSLILHAYLSRKARGIVGSMERAGVAFVNQVAKSRPQEKLVADRAAHASAAAAHDASVLDPGLVREQVQDILGEMLGPITDASVSAVDKGNEASVEVPA